MVALTTLMCPAWSGVFFLRNPQPGLQHEPQHMADPLRPTKREREIQVQAPVPADCPAPRRKSWLSRSPRHLRQHPRRGTRVHPGPGSGCPWTVGGSRGEAGRVGPVVTGEGEGRPVPRGKEGGGACAGESVLRPAPTHRLSRKRPPAKFLTWTLDETHTCQFHRLPPGASPEPGQPESPPRSPATPKPPLHLRPAQLTAV